MKIPIGISARHAHFTKEHLKILFGENYKFENFKDLSQPGQFAATFRVTIEGPRNKIENVRILGPERNYSQVEITKTDAVTLGVNPPVRESGDVKGSASLKIIGPAGEVVLEDGCIIASRHIHMHPLDLEKNKINTDKVGVLIGNEKKTVLKNVSIKVSDFYKLELHLDTDDANASLVNQGDLAEVVDVVE